KRRERLADDHPEGIHGFLIIGGGVGRAGGPCRNAAHQSDHDDDGRDAHAQILSVRRHSKGKTSPCSYTKPSVRAGSRQLFAGCAFACATVHCASSLMSSSTPEWS